VIQSFGDKRTRELFDGEQTSRVRKLPSDLLASALRKLDMLEAAAALLDLRSLPGNRLEALKGDLDGYYSIRVNDQWRLIFLWEDGAAHEVQLIDYHA
jgi:toxin HigB-1